MQDELLSESEAIGDADPRDRPSYDNRHSRARIDVYKERVQKAKKLEEQIISMLIGTDGS